MPVITVAQQKGGSGKTTLAVNLAIHALRAGRSVAVIDTDPQGSLGRWFMARRDALGDPGLEFATSSAWGVSYECEKLRKQVDLVIVDTPPKIDADLRPALREADVVVVPVSVSQVDLWATEGVLELARREGKPVLLVMNRVAPRARLTAEIAEGVADMDAGHTEAHLRNRVAFAEAMGRGLGVAEMARGKAAAADVSALAAEIDQVIGS